MSSNIDAKIFAFLSSGFLIASMFLGSRLFAAEATDPVPSQAVRLQDLNLDSAAGIAAAYRRVHSAATQVCATPFNRDSLSNRSRELACVAQSEARAVDQIHSPGLTAFYQRKLGNSVPMVASNGKM